MSPDDAPTAEENSDSLQGGKGGTWTLEDHLGTEEFATRGWDRLVDLAPLPFEETTREDRIRACYQHACLRYVTGHVTTNASLRERFKLPDDQNSTASRILRDTAERNLIKPVDPHSGSRRYTEYQPFWA